MNSIEEIRRRFEQDRFATENGAVIDSVDKNAAVCSMTIEARHRNAMGAVMGGAYFTLADFAFAVASNYEGTNVVSLSSNITFMGSAKGERMIATANCIKDGKNTCNYRVDITDENDNLLSSVTIIGYKLKKE